MITTNNFSSKFTRANGQSCTSLKFMKSVEMFIKQSHGSSVTGDGKVTIIELTGHYYILPDQHVNFTYILPYQYIHFTYILPDQYVKFTYILPYQYINFTYILPDQYVKFTYIFFRSEY